jgi:hypothetical protein
MAQAVARDLNSWITTPNVRDTAHGDMPGQSNNVGLVFFNLVYV